MVPFDKDKSLHKPLQLLDTDCCFPLVMAQIKMFALRPRMQGLSPATSCISNKYLLCK